MRGELCPYDHGAAPVVVTDVQELQKMSIYVYLSLNSIVYLFLILHINCGATARLPRRRLHTTTKTSEV